MRVAFLLFIRAYKHFSNFFTSNIHSKITGKKGIPLSLTLFSFPTLHTNSLRSGNTRYYFFIFQEFKKILFKHNVMKHLYTRLQVILPSTNAQNFLTNIITFTKKQKKTYISIITLNGIKTIRLG